MGKIIYLMILLATLNLACNNSEFIDFSPNSLKCEYRIRPIGIDDIKPHLSWILESTERGQKQTAYQILVASSENNLKKDIGDLWDSGKVETDQNSHIEYAGKPLDSYMRCYWKVRVWDKDGTPSPWSKPSMWTMGLLRDIDWGDAQWIAFEDLDEADQIVPGIPHTLDKGLPPNVLPQFRKEFSLAESLKQATLFISGLGHYELRLNGEKVGDHFLDPGWTNYRKTCLYAAYDITEQVKEGTNVLGVLLGNGMFFIPKERYRKFIIAFGYPKMILNLVLQYEDGSAQEIVSDETWKVSKSPITFTGIYGGEDYDATLEQEGWDQPGFDDSTWQVPFIVKGPACKLEAQSAPPLKVMETFTPIKITQPAEGIWVYDFGQNASGIPKISVQGKAHATVKITPGELLDDAGVVTQLATGSPIYFSYTLKGKGEETWSPSFTYTGFRYLQVKGAVPDGEENLKELPVIKKLSFLHTRNSAMSIGSFSCSNDLFNRIYRLVDWAIKSNMASVFTDCPHREKLGWLEQAHLMGSSVQYIYDIPLFFSKIVRDMQDTQFENGMVPNISPEYPIFKGRFRDSPEWGSAYVILPWYLYNWYGDIRPIKDNYEGMKRYVAYIESMSENHIVSYGLGDWFDLGPGFPGPAQLTPNALTATAIFYYDITILEKAAALLGNEDDVINYRQMGEAVKQAFNDTFFDKEKKQYASGSQTANAMSIFMGLVDPQYKKDVFNNLIEDIRAHNNSLTAGDIGFRYLLRVLETEGASNVIFDMNNRYDVPGYGYQLEKGATALTESWQAYPYVSNNHCMLGHIMEWFYSGIAGIQNDTSTPGFKKIVIKPEIIGDLRWAKGEYSSIHGKIATSWQLENNTLKLNMTIPANTTATVYLPAKDVKDVTESDRIASKAEDVDYLSFENGRAIYHVRSGSYYFESKLSK